MLCVRLIKDPFDLATFEEFHPDDLLTFIGEQYPEWPEFGRLYKEHIAETHDVTPHDDAGIEALENAKGVYYVVVWPGSPIIIAIAAVVAVIAITIAILLLMPKIPNAGTQETSSNNTLGQRTNKARPNGRICDIYGTVNSIPEMLTVPLLYYDNNLQVELCYMCVGRGAYNISNVLDGQTPLTQIAGAGARFYGPNTSPNSGVPSYNIGTPITQPLWNVVKDNNVNGQVLRPPNANAVLGNNDIRFTASGQIERSGTHIDFTKYFDPGDVITIGNANFGGSSTVFDATTQDCRFYSDYRVEFSTFDPTTLYEVGETIVIANAGFVGVTTGGAPVYVDLSGTYVIDHFATVSGLHNMYLVH